MCRASFSRTNPSFFKVYYHIASAAHNPSPILTIRTIPITLYCKYFGLAVGEGVWLPSASRIPDIMVPRNGWCRCLSVIMPRIYFFLSVSHFCPLTIPVLLFFSSFPCTVLCFQLAFPLFLVLLYLLVTHQRVLPTVYPKT